MASRTAQRYGQSHPTRDCPRLVNGLWPIKGHCKFCDGRLHAEHLHRQQYNTPILASELEDRQYIDYGDSDLTELDDDIG